MRKGPNFKMRVRDEEKVSWLAAMKKDGFTALATWVKWIVRKHIERER